MILLDTNVLIYASTEGSPFLQWARRTIAEGVSEDGAAVKRVEHPGGKGSGGRSPAFVGIAPSLVGR